MSKFTKGTWEYDPVAGNVIEFTDDEHFGKIIALLNPSIEKNTRKLIARLIAAAPEMYELLKEELIPSSDYYDGIVNFERKRKVKELLARIDEEAEMNEEIKPCPFCGGEGRIFEDTSLGWDNPLYHVFCGMCLARTDTAYHREDAIKIWNRRANDD